jgi:isoleucyl-tRNA synthetase
LAVTARVVAPIVPHLAEEVWLHHPENLSELIKFMQNIFVTKRYNMHPFLLNKLLNVK